MPTPAVVIVSGGGRTDIKAMGNETIRDYLHVGATYLPQRWVEDGKFVTSAGVSAGIDMARHWSPG